MIFYHCVAKLLLKKISHAGEKRLELFHLIFKNFVSEILKVNTHRQFELDEVLHKEKIKRLPSDKCQINTLVNLHQLQNFDK